MEAGLPEEVTSGLQPKGHARRPDPGESASGGGAGGAVTSPQGALWVTGGRRCPFTAWEASGGYKQGSTGSDCSLKRSVPAATSRVLVRPGWGRVVGGRPAGSGQGTGDSSAQTWDGVKVTPRWQRAQVLTDTQPPGAQQPQAREPDLYPTPAKPRRSPEGLGAPSLQGCSEHGPVHGNRVWMLLEKKKSREARTREPQAGSRGSQMGTPAGQARARRVGGQGTPRTVSRDPREGHVPLAGCSHAA